MRNFDVDQTAFIQGQCGYTFLFLVGVKVRIGTVERCLLVGKRKIEVVVDPSLIACVCLLRSGIRPIFVFDGIGRIWIFGKIFDIDSNGRSRALSSFFLLRKLIARFEIGVILEKKIRLWTVNWFATVTLICF